MAGNPQCSSSDEISISFENGINMTHLVFYMSYIDIDDIGTSVLYKSWMRHRIGNERHQDLCWTRLCHHRLRHHRLTRYRLSHHHCCSALLLWHLLNHCGGLVIHAAHKAASHAASDHSDGNSKKTSHGEADQCKGIIDLCCIHAGIDHPGSVAQAEGNAGSIPCPIVGGEGANGD